MADVHCAAPAGIARRDFMIAGAGATAAAAGLASPTSPIRPCVLRFSQSK